MYQVLVKRILAERQFSSTQGWQVTVHLDPMEVCRGGVHPEGKIEVAQICLDWFRENNVRAEIDGDFGKADFVARHPTQGTFVIEVEGTSSRIISQAFYSALGQTLVRKNRDLPQAKYGLAFPDTTRWRTFLNSLPPRLFRNVDLKVFLVSDSGVDTFIG